LEGPNAPERVPTAASLGCCSGKFELPSEQAFGWFRARSSRARRCAGHEPRRPRCFAFESETR
jgi:hypothetical protein